MLCDLDHWAYLAEENGIWVLVNHFFAVFDFVWTESTDWYAVFLIKFTTLLLSILLPYTYLMASNNIIPCSPVEQVRANLLSDDGEESHAPQQGSEYLFLL